MAYSNTLRVFRKKSGFNREKQFRDVYKLKLKEDQDLISVVHRGMIIVVGKLPGKEGFFDDIIPLDFLDKPEEKSSKKIDVRSVRYKKGIINLDIFYDDWMNKKTGKKNGIMH